MFVGSRWWGGERQRRAHAKCPINHPIFFISSTCSIFGQFGFGRGQPEEPQTPKGDTVVIELEVELQDLYKGKRVTVRRLEGGWALCVAPRVASRRRPASPRHRRSVLSSQLVRDKGIIQPAAGTRKCNCQNRMTTRQIGPGMYQQFATQVCEDCPNVKIVREKEEIEVHIEPGMASYHEINFFEQGGA